MTNATNTRNAVATARKVKDFNAARSDFSEAGYYTDGSKANTRKAAKRAHSRAVRRAARTAIAEGR